MGAEVPISDAARSGREGGTKVRDDVFAATGMSDSRNERAGGPRAFGGQDAAEAVGLGFYGRPERTYRDTVVQCVSRVCARSRIGVITFGPRDTVSTRWV